MQKLTLLFVLCYLHLCISDNSVLMINILAAFLPSSGVLSGVSDQNVFIWCKTWSCVQRAVNCIVLPSRNLLTCLCEERICHEANFTNQDFEGTINRLRLLLWYLATRSVFSWQLWQFWTSLWQTRYSHSFINFYVL